jgi:hypothetical protein
MGGVLAGVGIIVAVTVLMSFTGFLYLAVVLAWEDQRTRGSSYYAAPPEERDRFRQRLRLHARLLHPVVALTARLTNVSLERASFRLNGIAGPKGTCSPESFAAGLSHVPDRSDVFVVTQMKCGTTWMQHVVYQVLTRGQGGLAERGQALYAVSPWLEGLRSVSMSDAPLVGTERPSRIIKTHFPADVCPFDERARYVYVVRHPVSCFASCADFVAANLGVFAPGLEEIRGWFCGEETMWWGSWPRHVEGWWRRSQESDNVLFVGFEEMKSDLGGVVRRVAAHLGVSELTSEELDAVVHQCGFEYMRDHAISFEMHPPHLFAVDAELFVKGTSDRYRDVSPALREGITTWCSDRLREGDFPFAERYGSV